MTKFVPGTSRSPRVNPYGASVDPKRAPNVKNVSYRYVDRRWSNRY